jgi:thiol:disulfide interchange protein
MLTCVRGLIIFGLVVLAVGLVLIPLPGPGALLMALGGLLLVVGGIGWVVARMTSAAAGPRQRR